MPCGWVCELALATDLIVASKESAFGVPENKRGLVAGGGGLLRLPQRIPYAVAMELALTGERLSAQRAHELGLVNVLAEPGQALEAAIALPRRSPRTGRWPSPRPSASSSSPAGGGGDVDKQIQILAPMFMSNDAKEGAIAFAEKRPPKWTGS